MQKRAGMGYAIPALCKNGKMEVSNEKQDYMLAFIGSYGVFPVPDGLGKSGGDGFRIRK